MDWKWSFQIPHPELSCLSFRVRKLYITRQDQNLTLGVDFDSIPGNSIVIISTGTSVKKQTYINYRMRLNFEHNLHTIKPFSPNYSIWSHWILDEIKLKNQDWKGYTKKWNFCMVPSLQIFAPGAALWWFWTYQNHLPSRLSWQNWTWHICQV